MLLEDIAGGGPVTALRPLLCPEGGSESERATDHAVLARLTADPLDRHELGQAVESVPGQVGTGALAVLVLLLIREGDDQEVGPERGSGGETLLGDSWPFLSLPPTEAAVAEEDKCDEEGGERSPDQSKAVNCGENSHNDVHLFLNLLRYTDTLLLILLLVLSVEYQLVDVVVGHGVLLLDGDEAGGGEEDLLGLSVALDDDLLVLLHLQSLPHVQQVVGHVDDITERDGDGPRPGLEEEVVEDLYPGGVVEEDPGPGQGGEGGVRDLDLVHVPSSQLERQRGREVGHQELRDILHLELEDCSLHQA